MGAGADPRLIAMPDIDRAQGALLQVLPDIATALQEPVPTGDLGGAGADPRLIAMPDIDRAQGALLQVLPGVATAL
ncbi:MAG: hypothetical protein OEW73_00495 [Gammaproteobacteria bacterium]|nr:hypothetical protein [Gammaproteobacteria bacterium]MDH5239240.1 hypothetical protein [Gammaproteobacteria bacterium]